MKHTFRADALEQCEEECMISTIVISTGEQTWKWQIK